MYYSLSPPPLLLRRFFSAPLRGPAAPEPEAAAAVASALMAGDEVLFRDLAGGLDLAGRVTAAAVPDSSSAPPAATTEEDAWCPSAEQTSLWAQHVVGGPPITDVAMAGTMRARTESMRGHDGPPGGELERLHSACRLLQGEAGFPAAPPHVPRLETLSGVAYNHYLAMIAVAGRRCCDRETRGSDDGGGGVRDVIPAPLRDLEAAGYIAAPAPWARVRAVKNERMMLAWARTAIEVPLALRIRIGETPSLALHAVPDSY